PHHGLVHHPADARRRQSESHHHRHLQPHDGRLQLAPRRRTRHCDTALHAHVHHAHQPAPVTTSRRNDAMTQIVTPTLQSPQKAPRQRAPRKRRSVPLVLGIYAFVMAFLTALPLLILIPVSLNPKPLVGMPDTGLSLQWYANVFTNTSFPEAFLSSAIIAIFATTISLTVGSLAAWALTRSRFRGSSLVQGFLLSPLLLARIVYGVAMLIALTQLGLIRTTLGLVLAHSVIVVPYVVRIVGSTLLGIQSSLEEASAVLGAGQVRTFLKITLPLLTPGL